jgi:hypothetical protein
MIAERYVIGDWPEEKGYEKQVEVLPEREWAPILVFWASIFFNVVIISS